MTISRPLHFGVCAPSSYVFPETIEKGCAVLRSRGHHVVLSPQTYARLDDTQLAGTPSARAQALDQLYRDKDIDIIYAASGGNGAIHLLPLLDYDRIRSSNKKLAGYSDTTVLLNAIAARTGLIGYHAPTPHYIAYHPDHPCIDFFFSLLSNSSADFPMNNVQILQPGIAEGPLYGGNLSVFLSLLGSQYMPDLEGCILFFEDVNIETSVLDRMLHQIKIAGIFKHAKGIVLGRFSKMLDTGRPFGFTTNDIWMRALSDFSGPVVANAPFGHIDPEGDSSLFALPIGGKAVLTANAAGPSSLNVSTI